MQYRTLIGTADLDARIHDPTFVVVDCRYDLADVDAGERAYRAGHLPGARFMHVDRDLSGVKTGKNGRHPLPGISELTATFGSAGIDATKQVVAYDQGSGMWASRLWWLLQWLGHEAVAVLDGGIAKWTAEGRVLSRDEPEAHAAAFVARPSKATASTAEILDNLRTGTLKVLDARAPERFRGEAEPIDPVAGHIPGAINRPYAANLSSESTFKPAAQLRAEFEALLGSTLPSAVVHQCGSGVTACHNALAMAIAGVPGSRLYPGSWSEWIADPSRPVARGA